MSHNGTRPSAAQRARAFLIGLIERRWARNERRLPTIAAMCRQGGFSPATLSKAAKRLQAEGILSVAQRGGIRIRSLPGVAQQADPSAPPSRPAGPRWRRVKQRIAADIIGGRFRPGDILPSLKELCAEYGACFATVKRAVVSLADDRRLVAHGRGYRVYQPGARSSHACLVLIAHQATIGDLGTAIPRNPEFLRVLERECLRLGMRLVVCSENQVNVRRGTVACLQGSDVVLGYMLWIRAIPPDRLEELLRGLGRAGQPMAVLDEDGRMPAYPVTRTNPRIRVYTIATGRNAGIEIGNHLLGRGHRKVAYLTPVEDTLYSRNRHEGMLHAYEQAGLRNAVIKYNLEGIAGFEMVLDRVAHTRPFQQLRDNLSRFEQTVQQREQWIDDKFYSFHTETYLLRRALQTLMTPLFDRALHDSEVTAWVGVNDWVALVAMAHVRERGIGVPDRLALAGFDDTFEAFSHGLTSYDFNMPALVHAMLDHVLRPPSPRRASPLAPMEIPGTVLARASTSGDGGALGL
ncbi:MAG: GntR family transcriptional regulator [Chitinivibrionales bacterium]|nr:GntR family transcriptional regulator [Chitinivibrionales bacterium]